MGWPRSGRRYVLVYPTCDGLTTTALTGDPAGKWSGKGPPAVQWRRVFDIATAKEPVGKAPAEMPSLLERLLGEDTPDEQVDLETRQEAADDALQSAVDADALAVEDCAVTGVAVVNEGPDDEPIVVPIVRFSLGEDVEDPDMDLVWDLVGVAAGIVHEPFSDVFVRHYDVQFTFDGDGLFEAEECRRVALTDEPVERYATEPGFDAAALRDALLAEDDIDDEIAPVAWGQCQDYAQTEGAAVVVAGTAAAAGAGASAASCASTGTAAGAGGGAC